MQYKLELGARLVARAEWARYVRSLRSVDTTLSPPVGQDADAYSLIVDGTFPTCTCADGSSPTRKSPCADGNRPTCAGGVSPRCNDGSPPIPGLIPPCSDGPPKCQDGGPISCADGTRIPSFIANMIG